MCLAHCIWYIYKPLKLLFILTKHKNLIYTDQKEVPASDLLQSESTASTVWYANTPHLTERKFICQQADETLSPQTPATRHVSDTLLFCQCLSRKPRKFWWTPPKEKRTAGLFMTRPSLWQLGTLPEYRLSPVMLFDKHQHKQRDVDGRRSFRESHGTLLFWLANWARFQFYLWFCSMHLVPEWKWWINQR